MKNNSVLNKILIVLIGVVVLGYVIFIGFFINNIFINKIEKKHDFPEEYVIEGSDFKSFISGSMDKKIEYFEKESYVIDKNLSYKVEVELNQFCNKNDLIYIENGVEIKAKSYGYIKQISDENEKITIIFESIEKIKATIYLDDEDSKNININSNISVKIDKKIDKKEILIEYDAKISKIINEFNDKTNTISKKVELIIDNKIDYLFSTKDFLKIYFDYKELKNVIVIPIWYIFDIQILENEKIGYVYVLKSEKMEKTKIKIGNHDYNGNYHIIEGLEIGDKIKLNK